MPDTYSPVEFKTDRIVCLDAPQKPLLQLRSVQIHHQTSLHLFAEVIETITISSRCWVKPLAIARFNPENYQLELLHDLRDTAQLILPSHLFRDALDTEILPLISELFHPDRESNRSANAQKVLYQFIADLYQQ